MAFFFNNNQLDRIRAGVEEVESSGPDANWQPAYNAVIQAIEQAQQHKLVAVDDQPNVEAVRIWLKGALMVNAGQGRFSSFIRLYTQRQLALHGGDFTEAEVGALMQRSSDRIGEAVIKEGILGADNGELVTMDVIAERDAQQALTIVFASIDPADSAVRDGAAWSGTVLFPMFAKPGVTCADETARLLQEGQAGEVSTLEDLRNVLFAIDAYADASERAIKFSGDDYKIFLDLIFPKAHAGISWEAIRSFLSNLKTLMNQRSQGGTRMERILSGTIASAPVVAVRKMGLMRVVDNLSTLLVPDHSIDDSDFLSAARNVFGGLSHEQLDMPLSLLVGLAPQELVNFAQTTPSYLYALIHQAPFVFEDDAIYATALASGQLDAGQYSEEWLLAQAQQLCDSLLGDEDEKQASNSPKQEEAA